MYSILRCAFVSLALLACAPAFAANLYYEYSTTVSLPPITEFYVGDLFEPLSGSLTIPSVAGNGTTAASFNFFDGTRLDFSGVALAPGRWFSSSLVKPVVPLGTMTFVAGPTAPVPLTPNFPYKFQGNVPLTIHVVARSYATETSPISLESVAFDVLVQFSTVQITNHSLATLSGIAVTPLANIRDETQNETYFKTLGSENYFLTQKFPGLTIPLLGNGNAHSVRGSLFLVPEPSPLGLLLTGLAVWIVVSLGLGGRFPRTGRWMMFEARESRNADLRLKPERMRLAEVAVAKRRASQSRSSRKLWQ